MLLLASLVNKRALFSLYDMLLFVYYLKSFFGTSDPFTAGGGSEDPFASMGGGGGGGFSPFGQMGGMSNMGGGGRAGSMGERPRTMRKSEPITYDLLVNLDDLYTGKLKKVRITKKVADENSGRIVEVKVDKEIHIKPGWKEGTKITFERAGDELPGIQPADIIFVVHTRPHDHFERDGDDLIYNVSALYCRCMCHLTLLLLIATKLSIKYILYVVLIIMFLIFCLM
jgi:DnaJ-class molecular chaperone